MKAYTDLEQSKKLAEILPLESADMRYDEYVSYIDGTPKVGYKKGVTDGIPCWSLAALLGIMPKEVKIKGQIYAPCLFPIIDGHWLYKLWYSSNEIIESPIAVWCDNPIDACYEMIIKLHELNLL